MLKTKVKLPVTWQKYHSERSFIQQKMRILGHSNTAKGKINFPVMDYVRDGEIQRRSLVFLEVHL